MLAKSCEPTNSQQQMCARSAGGVHEQSPHDTEECLRCSFSMILLHDTSLTSLRTN